MKRNDFLKSLLAIPVIGKVVASVTPVEKTIGAAIDSTRPMLPVEDVYFHSNHPTDIDIKEFLYNAKKTGIAVYKQDYYYNNPMTIKRVLL